MKLTRFLLYALIISLPLGQLGKIPLGGNEVGLYLNDLLVGATFFAWLGFCLGIRKKVHLPPLTPFLLLFSLAALFSLVNGKRFIALEEFVVSSLYWLRWVLYSSLYFVVYDMTTPVRSSKSKIQNLLILSGLVLALAGFVQLMVLPDFTKLDPSLGWDPHKNRLTSTFFDPNFAGAYLVLTLVLISSRLLYSDVKGLNGVKELILGAIVFAALILTFSRSAWLMFAISMGIMGVLRSRKLLLVALVAFFAAYLLVPRVQTRIAGGVDPDDSASARITSWRRTLKIVKDYPLVGVGFNSFRYAQARYGFFDFSEPLGGKAGSGSDSSLLLVLATTGVVGLVFFVLLFFKALWPLFVGFWDKRSPPESKMLYLVVLSGVGGLLAESNFINSLFYPWIMVWLWVVLALAGAQVQSSK
jgi:O-antigen ligase